MVLFFLVATTLDANSFWTKLESQDSITIVVYGTSLTAESQWPEILINDLQKKSKAKIKLINSARSGQNSKWGLENLYNLVISKKPDIVFIEFAINDAHKRYKLTADNTLTNLQKMVIQIKSQLPNSEIILMTMSDAKGEAEANRQFKVSQYYQAVIDVAELNQLRLLNLYSKWTKLRQTNLTLYNHYMPDGLHPTDVAAKEFIVPAIIEELNE